MARELIRDCLQENAIALANYNVGSNLDEKHRSTIRFEKRDVLQLTSQDLQMSGPFNLIICNPPYIHTKDPSVSRSVRKWEPSLALYPLPRSTNTAPISSSQELRCKDEDIFYHKALSLAMGDGTDKIVLMEVGSKDQAIRVVQLATHLGLPSSAIIQIWRDWPDQKPTSEEETSITVENTSYAVKGSGLYRSVVIRRFGEPLYTESDL